MKALTVLLLLTTFAWAEDKSWKVSPEYIEAGSCSLFCPCYFNKHAQDHHTGEHHCNFNYVPRVPSGNYGSVDLNGLKVWLNGDLGDDWATKGEADWLRRTPIGLVSTRPPKSIRPAAAYPGEDSCLGVAIRLVDFPLSRSRTQT